MILNMAGLLVQVSRAAKGRVTMKPTVREIAKKAEVSIASVSLVLNNKPSRITAATKERILAAARALGYPEDALAMASSDAVAVAANAATAANTATAANAATKATNAATVANSAPVSAGISYSAAAKGPLRSGGRPLLGVIRPGYFNEFLDSCQLGMDSYAYVRGYKLISATANMAGQVPDCLDALGQAGVRGVILIPPRDMNENHNNELLGAALNAAGLPFLLLDEAIDRVYCDFITGDHKSGAYMATEYLIHQGHVKIGMLSGNREIYTFRKRMEGYKEALAFYGLSIRDEDIFFGSISRETGRQGMAYFDARGIRAIFACEDEMALGVYEYARAHGLRIGEDISLVGFGDAAAASILSPPLTSVTMPGELMGKKACEVLINRIEGLDREHIRTTYFTPSLVERESVKRGVN